jgi:pyrimidine deaminase RibD-like protein
MDYVSVRTRRSCIVASFSCSLSIRNFTINVLLVSSLFTCELSLERTSFLMDAPENELDSPDRLQWDPDDHLKWLTLALHLAKKSPPKPTNYCVGAVLISPSRKYPVLSTGYTLELPGNTHAEQCCFEKFANSNGCDTEELHTGLPSDSVLYTTMEPCVKRLSGNKPCVQRILEAKSIKKVFVGVTEPEKFVSENNARKILEGSGIAYEQIPGMEKEILEAATAGHEKGQAEESSTAK